MEKVNIFLTQESSQWFASMMEQAKHNIGFEDESWTTRAMMAIGPAGMQGKLFTVNEMGKALTPYVGRAENHHALNNMVRRAIRRGIIAKTGKKRYVEGTKNPYPEYRIHGYLEIDHNGYFHSVGMRKPDEGDDAGTSSRLRGQRRV